jgi:hypothetical protein
MTNVTLPGMATYRRPGATIPVMRCTPTRLIALILVVVLSIVVTTPAKAEADVLAAIGVASLVVAGVILVAYLVIATVSESRQPQVSRIVWIAMPLAGGVEAQ